jgi:hypothetical protein
MPIDASIALQTRGVQLDNPMDVMGKALTLRDLTNRQQVQQMEMEKAQRDRDQEQTLSELYRTNTNPDGTLNRQGLFGAAAQRGLGARIPAMQEQFAKADKATADVGHVKAQTGKIEFDTALERTRASAGVLQSLLVNPNTSHQDVINAMAGLVQRGYITPEQGQQAVSELPGDPARLRQYLMQKGLEVMSAKERLEALTPKLTEVDSGKVKSFVDTNTLTNPGGPKPVQKVTTPGEDLSAFTQRRGQDVSAATARRGQNMTDARAREANNLTREANATVYDAERGVLVNKGTGLARPAAMLDGKPLGQKPKDMTDAQSKALLFGARMKAANAALDKLAAGGTNMPSVIKLAADNIPLVGGAAGAVANTVVASKAQQQVEQAQRDFINAVLRRESGAVISEPEFINARKQYFPSVGDSPEVIAQKRQNRREAERLILAEVPLARQGEVNPTGVPEAQDFSLPPDIASIIKKHGGK